MIDAAGPSSPFESIKVYSTPGCLGEALRVFSGGSLFFAKFPCGGLHIPQLLTLQAILCGCVLHCLDHSS